MTFQEVLKAIAKDCYDNKTYREEFDDYDDFLAKFEFTNEQKQKYRKLDEFDEFWGGYAYLDISENEQSGGFIRLYSPQGSGKWCFWKSADGSIETDVC